MPRLNLKRWTHMKTNLRQRLIFSLLKLLFLILTCCRRESLCSPNDVKQIQANEAHFHIEFPAVEIIGRKLLYSEFCTCSLHRHSSTTTSELQNKKRETSLQYECEQAMRCTLYDPIFTTTIHLSVVWAHSLIRTDETTSVCNEFKLELTV